MPVIQPVSRQHFGSVLVLISSACKFESSAANARRPLLVTRHNNLNRISRIDTLRLVMNITGNTGNAARRLNPTVAISNTCMYNVKTFSMRLLKTGLTSGVRYTSLPSHEPYLETLAC